MVNGTYLINNLEERTKHMYFLTMDEKGLSIFNNVFKKYISLELRILARVVLGILNPPIISDVNHRPAK